MDALYNVRLLLSSLLVIESTNKDDKGSDGKNFGRYIGFFVDERYASSIDNKRLVTNTLIEW